MLPLKSESLVHIRLNACWHSKGQPFPVNGSSTVPVCEWRNDFFRVNRQLKRFDHAFPRDTLLKDMIRALGPTYRSRLDLVDRQAEMGETAEQPGIIVANVSWPDVEAALEAGATAVLPIGAAAKEHGLHLPMSTDFLQAEWLGARLVECAQVAVWPSLGYGYYPAFVDYPGSCSLSRQTFENYTVEILEDILRAGAKTILIVNTGISTIPALNTAIDRCFAPRRIRLANVYRGPRYRAAEARLMQQPRGSHADELETSIMLVIAPERVRMDKAQACTQEMIGGPLNRLDPSGPNYSPSGVYGDPCLATREKGEILVRAILGDLLAYLPQE